MDKKENIGAANGAFLESLQRNNSQIRKDRALAISEDAQLMYRRKLEDLEVSIRRMMRDQENMLDLSPENATSLKLASDFDAGEYVEKDTELSYKIKIAVEKLEIDKQRYEHLFGEAL
jgi:hypothetical protein